MLWGGEENSIFIWLWGIFWYVHFLWIWKYKNLICITIIHGHLRKATTWTLTEGILNLTTTRLYLPFVIPMTPALDPTMSIQKSGAWPVMPNMVVLRYFSCPAKSMKVMTLVEARHMCTQSRPPEQNNITLIYPRLDSCRSFILMMPNFLHVF